MTSMENAQAVGWLHRRAGFGVHPDTLAVDVERGPAAVLNTLIEQPQVERDTWAGVDLDPRNSGRGNAVRAWLDALVATDRPFHDRRTWMLHGWLVSSLEKVANPTVMVEQIQLYERSGSVDFADLLRDLTVDRAMLLYLDGRASTAAAPNENYGRELLELFGLGEGNYTEADVQAAAVALTGWTITRADSSSRFDPRRHDDTPQTMLGAGGVHDVDSVVDAVVNHAAHQGFVVDRIITEFLGPLEGSDRGDATDELVDVYAASGRQLDAVIKSALHLGLDGLSQTIVLDPIPWLIISARATGVHLRSLTRSATRPIREMGQVPLYPPSVSGWPRGGDWLTSSSLVARANVAAALARAADPATPLAVAAADGDIDQLADSLGLPEPFGPSTAAAIRSAEDPVGRLTVALVCPESLVA